MKKIFFLSLILSSFACSSSHDDSQNFDNNITGIWKMEKTSTISGSDIVTIISEYIPDDCKQKSTYEFNVNGKYIVNDYNYVGQDCQHINNVSNYTYLSSENKLIINNAESKIIELTNNKLVILVSDDYDSNGDGIDDYLKYTFKK
ncbi:hypothetical protein G6R40_02240 [Chryseobacterium sp. POL2]|uniref:lipocalin family protein n=1 Tax=Chryseobacterium sp. POL2 TaxID=2713414 RepID=UPI0013E1C757|nr:lipocalin family protein [Chryseobacterium sp. POL2]QIG88552.1 hypothetical protein G6R40_02240 [Chryseobacterium sp. POL2]